MARRPTQRPVTRGQRAPTNWSGTVAPAFVTVPALTKVLIQSFGPEFVSGETVRRMRGTVVVKAPGTGGYHGAIGCYVASNLALAAGVGSLLDPVTNVDDDVWMWYQSFAGHGAGSGSAGANGAQLLEIDSKSMRRVSTGMQLVFVTANSNVGLSYEIAFSVRLLGSEAS